MSNADAGWFLKAWPAERDSAGSKIAAASQAITVQALCLAGTVWEEAVRIGAAGPAVIGKAWREETAREEREITELATDLDTTNRTNKETVKELRTQVEEANRVARDNAAAADVAREQLTLEARQHAEQMAGLNNDLAEARATITTLQRTQDALIARIPPPAR